MNILIPNSSILPHSFAVGGGKVIVVVLLLINMIIGQSVTWQKFPAVDAPRHECLLLNFVVIIRPAHLLQHRRPQTAQFLTGTLRNTNDNPH